MKDRQQHEQTELAGWTDLRAQTVLGPVEAKALSVTLPHEHILADARRNFFSEPLDPEGKVLAHEPVKLSNLSWVRAHPLNNLDCLKMPSESVLIKELQAFKAAGGATIVDVSTAPMGGLDPGALQRLARSSGLNIIMGTGYYMGLLYSARTASLSEKELSQGMVDDINIGIRGSGVRAGIIGEIGLTPALREDERRLLRACAAAQAATGAPLSIHPPGLDLKLIERILRIVRENGGQAAKTVICHVDIMGLDREVICRIADLGCMVEFDTFGHLFPPLLTGMGLMNFPGEGQRIELIEELIKEGYLDQILLSQDTFLKVLLTAYGGFGYAHLLHNILPAMLRSGVTSEQVHAMTVTNPARMLAFAAA